MLKFKFLESYTPEDINQLCKEGRVKIQISVYEPEGEEVLFMENGERVIRTQEKIPHQHGMEIRSWNDLIQIYDKSAMYYGLNRIKC